MITVPPVTAMSRRAGFTLVEIMIVVAIIALLIALALPSFMRARQQSQNAAFADDLRIMTDAFQMYAAENGDYPPDATPGIVPTGMSAYFNTRLDFTATTPIGGKWDWELGVFNVRAGVSVYGPTASAAQILDIDKRIDDGSFSTGSFQSRSGRYLSIIEP